MASMSRENLKQRQVGGIGEHEKEREHGEGQNNKVELAFRDHHSV